MTLHQNLGLALGMTLHRNLSLGQPHLASLSVSRQKC